MTNLAVLGRTLRPLFFLVGALLSSGCGNSLNQDVCEQAANCGGGGELEVDACVIQLESSLEIAELYGCEDRLDEYLTCVDERGTCDKDKLIGCDDRGKSYKDCIDRGRRGKAKLD